MIRITSFFGLLASCVLITVPAFADDTVPLSIAAKPAPAIAFKDEGGNTQSLSPKQQKLSVVHFWATWCIPCVVELPEVNAAQRTYGDKGLKVIAISLDGDNSMDKVKKFYSSYQILHLTPYLDSGNTAFKAANLPGLPGTLFIDASGNEIARAEGPLDWKKPETVEFLEKALK